jgi:hypothetical protein
MEPEELAPDNAGDDVLGPPDLSLPWTTPRAEVRVGSNIEQSVGLSFAPRDKTIRFGSFTNAPAASHTAIATAMLPASVAGLIGAAGIGGICIWAGSPIAATLTLAMAAYLVAMLPVVYMIVRKDTNRSGS